MTHEIDHAKSVFLRAIDGHAPNEWEAYLDSACGDNTPLRMRVAALLQAHQELGSFRDESAGFAETTARPREAIGAQIGPYKLLQQIGEGGMGTVYMAEQSHPVQRKVALKVIKPGMDSRQIIARFEAERQALALMDHVNIARVLDAGTTNSGRPYFVMDLIQGVPINAYCDESRLTPRERLELFIPVCQAIQHAHQKGIIHRDIKPSNVMVTHYDGRPVPKVIDFGVAKAIEQKLTERTLFTQYGTLVGTLEYTSPEQAELSALGVDTRSDIYSLGVLLYELLTGTTPLKRQRVREAGYGEILRMIREEEPPKPSTRLSDSGEALASISAQRQMEPAKLTKLVRGELDWIVMKCLEKDRNRRYETVNSLAADVQRYLNDEPVQACPPSAWYRFRKFARRNKAMLATAAVVGLSALVAVAVLATSTVLIARGRQDTQNALQAETTAKDNMKRALDRERQESYFHRIALAHRELSVNNLGRALQLLGECPDDLREWEWHYLMRLCRVEPVILRDKIEINSLAFSADGEHLAGAGGNGVVKVWNSRTREVVQTLDAHADSTYSVVFHRDGKHLASAGADRRVKVWDLTTGKLVFSGRSDADHNRGVAHVVAFSADGRKLAAGSDGAVNVWDWEQDQLLLTLPGHAKRGISVAFSPDGRRLASGSWSGDVMIWDAVTGERLHILAATRHPVSALAFSPDSQQLVSACFDRRLIVWDATTGALCHTLRAHSGLVLGVAFSPDGKRIASVGEDKTVRIWEAATGREVLDLRGHTHLSQSVKFSPDSRCVASASEDGTIRIWDATPLQGNEAQEAFTFSQRAGEVWTMALNPDDGQSMVSAGLGLETSPVKVWDVRSGRVNFEFTHHEAVVFCVAWHPDGQRIASSGWERERKLFVVKVWNARTGEVDFELPAGMETFAFAFSRDGDYLVTGRANGTVQIWDARPGREGQPLGNLGSHSRHVRGVVFSRDGGHVATASGDGVMKLWNWDVTHLGQEQEPRRFFHARVPLAAMTMAFSPDGQRLVAGGDENSVNIWDLHTGQEQTLRGHTGDVWATAFSPDPAGRWIASAGDDSTVKVWDSHTGTLLRSFRGHTGLVSSVMFSPDGRQLYSGSRDMTVKVWDVSQLSDAPSEP
jgi:WD40 repeat protein/serine/threonine protein kinase